jgi:hypothetical protein
MSRGDGRNSKLETGNWKRETGKWQGCFLVSSSRLPGHDLLSFEFPISNSARVESRNPLEIEELEI